MVLTPRPLLGNGLAQLLQQLVVPVQPEPGEGVDDTPLLGGKALV